MWRFNLIDWGLIWFASMIVGIAVWGYFSPTSLVIVGAFVGVFGPIVLYLLRD